MSSHELVKFVHLGGKKIRSSSCAAPRKTRTWYADGLKGLTQSKLQVISSGIWDAGVQFCVFYSRSDFCNPFFSVWSWTSSCYLNSECYCLSWPALISGAEISYTCWNSSDNLLDSEQIWILQNLFLFVLFSQTHSPPPLQSPVILEYTWQKNRTADGAAPYLMPSGRRTQGHAEHVWSNRSLSRQTLRNVGT